VADTTLNIKASLTGRIKEQVSSLRKEFGAWHLQQQSVLKDQAQLASRASSLWEQTTSGASKAAGAVGGLASSLTSIKTIMLGLGTAAASGPIYQKLIGSNADLERARTTFDVLVGDAKKSKQLIGDVRAYAAATPFGEGELIEGSKRFLRLTGSNIEENKRLLKLAGTLAAINPSKSIEDAAEAILDAEGLEFERLKEFGIKLKSDDVKKSKKKGETLGQAALRGFADALNKQTGGRDVVAALGGTAAGQISTLQDRVGETIRKAGVPAFDVFKTGLQELNEQLNGLESDPKLREEFEAVQRALASGAESIVEMIKRLPQGIAFARALKDEVMQYSGALKAGAVLYGANKVTGGAIPGALASGASRLLYGRGGAGGATASALGGDAAAMPVRVVNFPAGGGLAGGVADAVKTGKDSFTARNTGGAGFGSTARAFGSALVGDGAIATLGAGGAAAGGGLLALFGAAAVVQLDVMRRTQAVAMAFEEREKRETALARKNLANARKFDEAENKDKAARNAKTFGTRSYFDAATAPGVSYEEKQANALKGLQAAKMALGGSDAKIKGKAGSKEQQEALAEVNKSVEALGIRFGLSKGSGGSVNSRLRVFSGESALNEGDKGLVEQFRKINTLKTKNPDAYAALSTTPEFKELNKEAVNLRARIGRGNQLEGDIRNAVANVQIGKIELTFAQGTDPNDAKVIADQLTTEIEKAMRLVKQRQ